MKNAYIIFALIILWFVIRPFVVPATLHKVEIPRGSSVQEVAAILKQSEIISRPFIFIQLAKINSREGNLKSGTYELSSRDTMLGIIAKMRQGDTCLIKVTIPEGFTAKQISERLAAKDIIDPVRFRTLVREQKLEGYLFPATYSWKTGSSEEQIIKDLVRSFNTHVNDELKHKIEKAGLTLHDTVILASIIEKEAKLPEERTHIAGVFRNRLRKHWKLESCATVRYALEKDKQALSVNELKIDTPYNTYLHYGLPQGPICNPGLESLRAAAQPASTDDLFFRTYDSRTHKFSQSYQDHMSHEKVSSSL